MTFFEFMMLTYVAVFGFGIVVGMVIDRAVDWWWDRKLRNLPAPDPMRAPHGDVHPAMTSPLGRREPFNRHHGDDTDGEGWTLGPDVVAAPRRRSF
jgi:hypothetical protein